LLRTFLATFQLVASCLLDQGRNNRVLAESEVGETCAVVGRTLTAGRADGTRPAAARATAVLASFVIPAAFNTTFPDRKP
jgi:hypothetical protein